MPEALRFAGGPEAGRRGPVHLVESSRTVGVMVPGAVDIAIAGVRLHAPDRHQAVVVDHLPAELEVVGAGTDAVVVRHPALPGYVFKVYAPEARGCLDDEYRCYGRLAGSPLFATCAGRSETYLVLSYEAGPTLYDCLREGIQVPERVIADVEAARDHARRVGLRPKDIHLKNVIVQDGHAKMIDVSKYALPGDNDPVWEALAEGYHRFYPMIRGRAIPVWVIEMAKRAYQQQDAAQFSLDAFAGRMLRMLRGLRVIGPPRRSPSAAA